MTDAMTITDSDFQFLCRHLQLESQYLDFLIHCSEQIREQLSTEFTGSPDASVNPVEPPSPVEGLPAQLEKLAKQQGQPFSKLADERNQLKQLLRQHADGHGKTPSLRQFIRRLPPKQRLELMQVRDELNRKLIQIQSINAGTQTVLAYTMNYYERFLNGISGQENNGSRYSASGAVPHLKAGILGTEC